MTRAQRSLTLAQVRGRLHALTQLVLGKPQFLEWAEEEAHGVRPTSINRGWCGVWAPLARRLVGGELLASRNHVVLRRSGLFFDAENTHGARRIRQIPFYYKHGLPPGDTLDPVTAEASLNGWSGNTGLDAVPYHWLRELAQARRRT